MSITFRHHQPPKSTDVEVEFNGQRYAGCVVRSATLAAYDDEDVVAYVVDLTPRPKRMRGRNIFGRRAR